MSRDRYERDDDWRYEEGGGGVEDRYGAEAPRGYGGGSRGREYGDYGSRGGERERGYGRDYGRDYRRDYGRGAYDESRYRGGGYYDEGRERDDYYARSRYDEGRGRYDERVGRRAEGRSRVRCRDIMTKDVVVATRDTTLQKVAEMMRDEDTGVIPVVERRDAAPASATNAASGIENPDEGHSRSGGNGRGGYGKLVGLITDRDIVIRAIADGRDATLTRAEEVMTTDIHTAQPNDRVVDAIRKMGDKQVRRIPVVDGGGHLRGIISMADVALETEEDRELADALEEISSGASFWSKIFG